MVKGLIDPPGLESPQKAGPAKKILLVEDNPGDVRLVQEALASQNVATFEVTAVSRLGESLIRLGGESFDLVLLDLSLPDGRGLDTLRRMRSRASSTPIVVMTGLSDEALALTAVNEGAQDYLVKGETDGHALARRLCFAIERRRASVARPLNEPAPRGHKTMAFLGSKGGVGVSTLACHVAIKLQTRTNDPLLLADFDFESGVLGFLLDAEPKYSIVDILQNVDRLDADLWKALVHNKTPGLDLIVTPFAATQEPKTTEQFQKLLVVARSRYRWIVADLGRGFNQNVSGLLEDIDVTYLVTTLELAALRQARLMIQKLKQMGCRPDSLRVIVNELPKRCPFSSGNLEEMLGFPLWATIPYIPEIRESHGRSVSLPRTPAFLREITRMAERIAGMPEEPPKGRWPYLGRRTS